VYEDEWSPFIHGRCVLFVVWGIVYRLTGQYARDTVFVARSGSFAKFTGNIEGLYILHWFELCLFYSLVVPLEHFVPFRLSHGRFYCESSTGARSKPRETHRIHYWDGTVLTFEQTDIPFAAVLAFPPRKYFIRRIADTSVMYRSLKRLNGPRPHTHANKYKNVYLSACPVLVAQPRSRLPWTQPDTKCFYTALFCWDAYLFICPFAVYLPICK